MAERGGMMRSVGHFGATRGRSNQCVAGLLALVRRWHLILGSALIALVGWLRPVRSYVSASPAPNWIQRRQRAASPGLPYQRRRAQRSLGENPGEMSHSISSSNAWSICPGSRRRPMTCLTLRVSTAVIKFDAGGISASEPACYAGADGGSGLDLFGGQLQFGDSDRLFGRLCGFRPPVERSGGGIRPPLRHPRTSATGGFAQFGFNSQRQCIVFVVLTRIFRS